MRHTTLLFLLAALLLAGCAHDDVSPEQDNSIRFNVDVWKMMSRANIINDNTGLQSQDIKIDAYYHDTETKYLNGEKLHFDTDAWKFWDGSAQLHYYWPIEGSVETTNSITVSSLDFVGFCPYATPSYITTGPTYNHSTGITFTATMPTTEIDDADYMTSTSQADFTEFMCAYSDSQTKDTNSGTVNMTFKHSFAYVKFSLSSATTKNVIVDEITINDLKTSGSCLFNGATSTWSTQSGSATMKLTEALQRGSARDASSPFLVIPYDYESAKTLTVQITWKEWDEVHNMTFTTPLDIDWAAGYSYTYSLTVTKDDLKVDILKFTEQW